MTPLFQRLCACIQMEPRALVLNPHLMRLIINLACATVLREELALIECSKARTRLFNRRLILLFNLSFYCCLIGESAQRWRCARRSLEQPTSHQPFTTQPRGDNNTRGADSDVADWDNDFNGDDWSLLKSDPAKARLLRTAMCDVTGHFNQEEGEECVLIPLNK